MQDPWLNSREHGQPSFGSGGEGSSAAPSHLPSPGGMPTSYGPTRGPLTGNVWQTYNTQRSRSAEPLGRHRGPAPPVGWLHHPVPQPRVAQDDELSSTHSREASPTRTAAPSVAQSATPPLPPPYLGSTRPPAFRTPITSPRQLNYVGAAAYEAVPPERRQGPPILDDRMLNRLLESHRETSGTRGNPQNPYRPHLLRHHLPLSSSSSSSAVPTPTVSRPAGRPPTSSLDLVTDAVRFMQQHRQQSRRDAQVTALVQAMRVEVPPVLEVPTPKAPPPPPPVAHPPIPVFFDGNEDTCSICAEGFEHGDQVCRLVCRHMFHAACWNRMYDANNNNRRDDCPNCRGAGSIIAVWRYIDERILTQQLPDGIEAPNELTNRTVEYVIGSPRSSATGSVAQHGGSSAADTSVPQDGEAIAGEAVQGPDTSYVAFDHDLVEKYNTYHVLRLADGRPSLVVDPGSVGNLSGDSWCREVAAAAARHGKRPSYERRPRPLQVSGVGNGSQKCQYDCKLPVALRKKDGETISMGVMTTPTVSQSQLPGLLGLTALRKNRAILDSRRWSSTSADLGTTIWNEISPRGRTDSSWR